MFCYIIYYRFSVNLLQPRLSSFMTLLGVSNTLCSFQKATARCSAKRVFSKRTILWEVWQCRTRSVSVICDASGSCWVDGQRWLSNATDGKLVIHLGSLSERFQHRCLLVFFVSPKCYLYYLPHPVCQLIFRQILSIRVLQLNKMPHIHRNLNSPSKFGLVCVVLFANLVSSGDPNCPDCRTKTSAS